MKVILQDDSLFSRLTPDSSKVFNFFFDRIAVKKPLIYDHVETMTSSISL